MDCRFGTMQASSCANGLLTNACAHRHTLTHTHTVRDTHNLSNELHYSYSHCLTIHICKVHSTNCECVFVVSILTTACCSNEQTVEYTYTFLIYSPPPDLPSRFYLPFLFHSLHSIHLHLPSIITMLLLMVNLSFRHT